MTEVPEHLLRRSRERKAQASGEAGGDAPAEAASGDAAAVEPAAAAAPAGAGGGPPARPKQPEFTGPPQPPKRNARLPVWAMPVVAALPFWAMLYAGSFGERGGVEEGPLAEGAAVFSNCSTCHGSNGEGGGTGPALTDVVATFPEFDAHVAWVTEGSAAVRGQEYAPGKVATGGMPGFGSSLSPEQIIAVVCHERVTIAGQEPVPAQCEADAAAETNTEGGADAGTAENEDAGAG
ncbi:MAG TPA: c-type cytochrome [Acidimicrobiales bacterium]|nr:c-type cytochrome [Acidimicrobiales bacterium]